ncbi:hypothetical protein SCATT_54170 [Streptantibioticus cattleyicolor NRRL 8057 = DSM 46488]|uniref:DUF1275 domain-containing protein n=1 Tax=Streptantibioticus cattleyicolor (strain ATCC 35852 / DSM 46488 / JCM 4925 / NBRC 14057 / NRRL 8057) TaxID=1003195 RepID=F8JQE5_STREN|nr:hypothetical protein SCATT_54170 [Streptantibioticus cattleyicolor NRRL 8057 = DSM 46488]CCB78106.1 conserved membrane protein of unknown function [Streptantibioticus cattleyicolor NRRL 8057 = DSM 46488]
MPACLGGEVALLAVATGLWAACGGAPGGAARRVLLVLAALAMGVQSGAMLAASPALRPSTYLTGTLATFLMRGAGGLQGTADRWVPVRLLALAAGAAATAAVRHAAPAWAAALPSATVAAGLLTALPRRRMNPREPGT